VIVRSAHWLALLLALPSAGCNLLEVKIAHYQLGRALCRPAQAPPGRMEIVANFPVVHLYGTPGEMGRQYGQMLGPALRALHTYMDRLVPTFKKDQFLEYARAHEKNLPGDIRAELGAIAEASGMPYLELVALNTIPRVFCSALAVWKARADGDAGLILGKNSDYFDMGLRDRGMILVVYHRQGELPLATVSFLGQVGAFTGMNAQGVCFSNLLVFNAAGPPHDEDGLTIQIALRQAARRAGSAQELVRLLQQGRHAIPMNVMAADSREALVAELGVGRSAVRYGTDGVLACSNGFLLETMAARPRPCPRYDRLLEAGNAHRGDMTVERMEKALFASRIPNINIQAFVFEPGKMRMHVSVNRNPASAGPYVPIDVRKLFEDGNYGTDGTDGNHGTDKTPSVPLVP